MLLVESMLSDIRQRYFSVLWSVLFNRIQATSPPSAWKQNLAVLSCHWFWKKLCTQRSSMGVCWGYYTIWPFNWCIKIAAFPLLLLLIKSIVGISPDTMCWFAYLLLRLESILPIVASQRTLVILFLLYPNDQLCVCHLGLLYAFSVHVCLERKQAF